MDYLGKCHCGAVGFRYSTEIDPADWSVRACQCSFCRAHDALSTSDPDGELGFTARDETLLQRYRFGLGTADFLLCRNCGSYLGAMVETSGGRFGIVNTRLLQPRPADIPAPAPATYDGEDAAGRIARRERRWSRVGMVP